MNQDSLVALTSLANSLYEVALAGSVCVLSLFQALVILLLLQLLTRRPAVAVAVTYLILAGGTLAQGPWGGGWPIAILSALLQASAILVFVRFGLLAATTTVFMASFVTSAVITFDLSAWYADSALVPIGVLAALMLFGAATALAGRPILGDPLKEPAGRS
jgi:hypothetical protein